VAAVTKEQLKSPRARLFVALDLPEELRDGIAAWGREALTDPALRPVAPESLHITLAFLGHRDEKEIEEIAAVVVESTGVRPAQPCLGTGREGRAAAQPPDAAA